MSQTVIVKMDIMKLKIYVYNVHTNVKHVARPTNAFNVFKEDSVPTANVQTGNSTITPKTQIVSTVISNAYPVQEFLIIVQFVLTTESLKVLVIVRRDIWNKEPLIVHNVIMLVKLVLRMWIIVKNARD